MNILIPDDWLREYLQTELTPEELAARGSLHGPSFERIEMVDGEPVYDIEVTTNRVDMMSVAGMAREMQAILGSQAKITKRERRVWADLPRVQEMLPLPEIKVQTDAVKRIMCVVLSEVKNNSSPVWLQQRLKQIGQNSHGIIVDMTNYITHELGHPCHAFDYDKVMAMGGQIIVKQATAGKQFVTLDGEQHQTVGEEIVFESKSGEIIDLPAIKGTANTAIDEQTTRVLFWLENMEAKVVRMASMQHAIRTVAAILNEKDVDQELMDEVLLVGSEILVREAGAKISSEVYEYRRDSEQAPIVIELRRGRLTDYLGVEIEAERVQEILQALGFTVRPVAKDQCWQVVVPSWRAHEVTMEADLIEEVARIYGYHNLPSRVDFAQVQIPKQEGVDFQLETRVKHFLVDNGWTEVYTYSMIGADQLTRKEREYLRLSNPLTEDKVFLRQDLGASLERVWADNQVQGEQRVGIFELASVYVPGKTRDVVVERLRLALLTPLPYREGRRVIENMLRLAHIEIDIGKKGEIKSSDGVLLGKVETRNGVVWIWEFDWPMVIKARKDLNIIGFSGQSPIILEDMTFVIKDGEIGRYIKIIKKASEWIKKVTLGDIYQDHYTFHLVYQRRGDELTSSQLRPIREKIVVVMAKAGAELVGQLPTN